MKRCEYCHFRIDIEEGHYINLYTNPAEMHTFHESCYTSYLKNKKRIPGRQINLDNFEGLK